MSQTKAPSKYHDRVWRGGEEKYGWSWNSSHPDLTPTKLLRIEIGYESHTCCAYCGGQPFPIQAYLRDRKDHHNDKYFDYYQTTGYTCICDGAEAERAYLSDLENLKKQHEVEINELRQQYIDRLYCDPKLKLNKQKLMVEKQIKKHQDPSFKSFNFSLIEK